MIEIIGKSTSAKVFADDIEPYAQAQIQLLCDHPSFSGSKVRVMPDVHPGKVGTIGFTATVGPSLMPNVVGIDIGCGMLMAKLKDKRIEYAQLDAVIRDCVPSGFRIRGKAHPLAEQFDADCLHAASHIKADKAALSLGTLGGGNHFIEVDKGEDGLYVIIHTGSRRLGKEITEYYLSEGQRVLRERGQEVPFELTVLDGDLLYSYLHDVAEVQRFAALNRRAILAELVKGMKWKVTGEAECVHNYIDTERMILRKGAISARQGEPVIIPINMRDGVILGTGKGNEDWNCSAPHGAGRVMKREDVRQRYTVSQFKKEMKGIYSSCIGKETLDEAPFAYRGLEQIAGAIGETAEITQVLKPVYSFKAGNEE